MFSCKISVEYTFDKNNIAVGILIDDICMKCGSILWLFGGPTNKGAH